MSTRATYEFRDDIDKFVIYKHSGGNPFEALKAIKKALEYAWPLPRYEACEFAAAFVAANKQKNNGYQGGGVYLSTDAYRHGDTDYHYLVEHLELGQLGFLHVVCYDRDNNGTWKFVTQGPLEDLLNYFKERE